MRSNTKKAPELSAELYDQLRKMARRYFSNERKNHTLAPTALVHEAFIRLAGETSAKNAGEIPPAAVLARLMREVLINHAKARGRKKRGGGRVQVTLNENLRLVSIEETGVDLLLLDEAL